jgi:hypothetical protein
MGTDSNNSNNNNSNSNNNNSNSNNNNKLGSLEMQACVRPLSLSCFSIL